MVGVIGVGVGVFGVGGVVGVGVIGVGVFGVGGVGRVGVFGAGRAGVFGVERVGVFGAGTLLPKDLLLSSLRPFRRGGGRGSLPRPYFTGYEVSVLFIEIFRISRSRGGIVVYVGVPHSAVEGGDAILRSSMNEHQHAHSYVALHGQSIDRKVMITFDVIVGAIGPMVACLRVCVSTAAPAFSKGK